MFALLRNTAQFFAEELSTAPCASGDSGDERRGRGIVVVRMGNVAGRSRPRGSRRQKRRPAMTTRPSD